MTSFNRVMMLTHSNWFQTNPLEHESDDPADLVCRGVCVLSMVTICHFSGKYDQHLSLLRFRKTEIQDKFQNLLTIVAQYLQINV